MNFWLVKSEPDKYGWHHFTEQGRAVWDGVRNYQARNNLRAMQPGDLVLFYHSVTRSSVDSPGVDSPGVDSPGVDSPGVEGLANVVRGAYPDPTIVNDPAQEKAGWVAVDLEPVLAFDKPVTLSQIKAEPLLANMGLIKQSRLSVMPIRSDEFELILKLGQVAGAD